jgi:signal transduction histidine kinase
LDRTIVEGFLEELRPVISRQDEIRPAAALKGTRPTVLVVEDNPEMNRFIVETLSGEFDVISAFDGQEGLEQALASNPTLIVSDIMMPKVSGVEMIAEMRKQPSLVHVPIILLSAKADEELKIKLLEGGANDFVAKPFSERDLLVRVRNMIRLRKSEQKLEETVSERTARLRETIGELESFSYSIVHDLRAPLRSMQGFSDLVSTKFSAQLNAEGQSYLKRIGNSAARMDRLINDVLSYSLVARAELVLEPIATDKLAREIVDTYANLRAERENIQVEGVLPIVMGHETALAQCFSNLLGNAVKFVATGMRPSIRVWSDQTNGRARIFVEDKGIGIPENAHERIFGLFERATHDYEGTGIGLPILKKSIDRMGGTVGLKSTLGKGTTFWLELALA